MVEERDTERTLRDSRGCLTAEGLALLRELTPGQVPDDLAIHLSGCVSCQQRALEMESGPRKGPKREVRPILPSMGRAALFGLLFLIVLGLLLWTLRRLIEG